ncbi:MAG: hypothetical protein ACHQ1D_02550 [Nitrososphaerales archaeon]
MGWCKVNDIIEKGDYAKYICNDGTLTLTRQYNNTSYEYWMNATIKTILNGICDNRLY